MSALPERLARQAAHGWWRDWKYAVEGSTRGEIEDSLSIDIAVAICTALDEAVRTMWLEVLVDRAEVLAIRAAGGRGAEECAEIVELALRIHERAAAAIEALKGTP